MPHVAKSTCRSCVAYCPIDVTIDEGRVIKVEGNSEAPLYGGFICPKGRALAAAHNDPKRLTHSLKRMPDGSHQPISSEQLVDEISTKLRAIIDRDGPQAVAGFNGNASWTEQQAVGAMLASFMGAIGSDHFFTNSTIDQPGTKMASVLHGTWAGGRTQPENCDVYLMVGGNPIISKQYFPQNPGQQLKRLGKKGMKLIVIDPRRTETAHYAHVHLQCLPGEDPTIIAGLIHLIVRNGKVDQTFVEQNAAGFEALVDAVSAFTPDYVAQRAGIEEKDLLEAARILGEARTGDFGSGVGPSMATRGTLTGYLMLCLQTLRGFWAKEGDEAVHPRVLLPRQRFKAQPIAGRPAWGFDRKMRVRGLEKSVVGVPTAALPGEILTPGEGQIRALFLHSGAMLSWPQPELTKQAFESLELFVVHDVEYSATARAADYIVATKQQLEVPVISQFAEICGVMHAGYGWVEPFASYQPALVNPPAGSDVLDAWQLYYRLAQKLGLQLKCGGILSANRPDAPLLDMQREPSTDELYEIMCQGSVVPLAEVKKFPNGKLFDEAKVKVGPRDPGCVARLDLANPHMLEELRTVRAESIAKRRGTSEEFPFLFIPRRIQNITNANYRPDGLVKPSYNPAYMHASDLEALGMRPGDMIEICSRHGSVVGFVDVDNHLRPGLLSMSHGFGKGAGQDSDPRRDGTNVNRLLHWEDDYDPYHGMPRMGAVPVAVKPAMATGTASH